MILDALPRVVILLVALGLAGAAHADGDRPPKSVTAARAQVGVTVDYDPSYQALDYPGGDLPRDRGVCTDVVIRALRDGLGIDLQMLVHEDMKSNFSKYPTIWKLKATDRNIDHRRVPNLRRYFQRHGWELELPEDPAGFEPGDLVTCTVPPNLPHIMVVSDRVSEDGIPLVIHNIGSGTKEENRLADFPLTGRYRVPAPPK